MNQPHKEPSHKLTAELLESLTIRGPRYTSYPTALQFHEEFATKDVQPKLDALCDPARPVSLYFHVLYCQQLCWYCACHRKISNNHSVVGEQYVKSLCVEVDAKHAQLADRKVTQIHLGGGTPTFLQPKQLEGLIRHVRKRFDVTPGAEISIEIDPRTCTLEHVKSLAKAGFNRASIGVQDTDPKVQKLINRVQPIAQTTQCVEQLRAHGIEHINFDLIYGLPGQNEGTIAQTLRDVLALDPDRLAVYGYAHVPWAHPAQKLLEKDAVLPNAHERIVMLTQIVNTLESKGYVHIGMDHFARPTDSLTQALEEGELQRNFQGYSTQRGVDIHGFGPSAITATQEYYAQNLKDVASWQSAVSQGRPATARGVECSSEDQLRRDVIMQLMCRRFVPYDFVTQQGEHFDLRLRFADAMKEMRLYQERGLVLLTKEGVEVTQLGRHFLRNLAILFDAYHQGENMERFSKTV